MYYTHAMVYLPVCFLGTKVSIVTNWHCSSLCQRAGIGQSHLNFARCALLCRSCTAVRCGGGILTFVFQRLSDRTCSKKEGGGEEWKAKSPSKKKICAYLAFVVLHWLYMYFTIHRLAYHCVLRTEKSFWARILHLIRSPFIVCFFSSFLWQLLSKPLPYSATTTRAPLTASHFANWLADKPPKDRDSL